VRPMLSGPAAAHELPTVRSRAAFGSPFLTCTSEAIPFRTYAVAESTGINDNKGAQPLRPALPDCACQTSFYESECGDWGIAKPGKSLTSSPPLARILAYGWTRDRR